MVAESWAGAGSALASLMFVWAMARQFFPRHFHDNISKYTNKLLYFWYPYIHITFPERSGERMMRDEAYSAIESYLSSSCSERARNIRANMDLDKSNLVLSMDEDEEVTDEFQGAKVWWHSISVEPDTPRVISWHSATPPVERYYRLTVHKSERQLIMSSYIPHVMERGKAIKVAKRQRKLYTNHANYDSSDYWNKQEWVHVPFEHPATFNTLAMDPIKKKALVQDLKAFSQSKDYYLDVGKPWKRGYLLYGPPGTGKSSMIAAMANLLDYDVYDLELTAVKNNTKLRKLLIETTNKSIIVIEDIDCSLNLSRKRKDKPVEALTEEEKLKGKAGGGDEESKVTLSGLLNFIDGLWSACGEERLMVFTTNYIDKLDPALIRRGRMDMLIELTYCTFEGFKTLAKNYLRVEAHALFGEIEELMEKRQITPADVAENLMPKTLDEIAGRRIEACLENLIAVLKDLQNQGRRKWGTEWGE